MKLIMWSCLDRSGARHFFYHRFPIEESYKVSSFVSKVRADFHASEMIDLKVEVLTLEDKGWMMV